MPGSSSDCSRPCLEPEIHAAREAGPPFLCTQHMAEELPAEETGARNEPPEGGLGGPPRAA